MTIFEHLKKLQLQKLHMSPHPFRRPSPTPQTSPLTLKVSRDFVPTPASIALLRKNDGIPTFTSFTSHEPRISEEIYLDSPCHGLVTNGILVRLRNGVPEALVRDVNNRFLEYDYRGDNEVEKVVVSTVPGKHLRLQDLLLTVWAGQLREEWQVDGFKVMVGSVIFGPLMSDPKTHAQETSVGEVELCRDIGEGGRVQARVEMNGEMDAFVEKHEWAFPESHAGMKEVKGILEDLKYWEELIKVDMSAQGIRWKEGTQ